MLLLNFLRRWLKNLDIIGKSKIKIPPDGGIFSFRKIESAEIQVAHSPVDQ